jgi:hypothetical protein
MKFPEDVFVKTEVKMPLGRHNVDKIMVLKLVLKDKKW